MHSFEVHSNESACRKSGRLGLGQVCMTSSILTLNILLDYIGIITEGLVVHILFQKVPYILLEYVTGLLSFLPHI